MPHVSLTPKCFQSLDEWPSLLSAKQAAYLLYGGSGTSITFDDDGIAVVAVQRSLVHKVYRLIKIGAIESYRTGSSNFSTFQIPLAEIKRLRGPANG